MEGRGAAYVGLDMCIDSAGGRKGRQAAHIYGVGHVRECSDYTFTQMWKEGGAGSVQRLCRWQEGETGSTYGVGHMQRLESQAKCLA